MRFTVDGFPRQGNTTLTRVIKNVFGNEIVSEYPSHDLETIENDLNLGSITLCPVRNPLNTIGSFCEMQMLRFPENRNSPKHDHMIDHALNTLKIFQDYMIKNINKIHIIKFEDIIQMSEDYKNQNIQNNKIINKLAKQYSLKTIQRIDPLFDSLSSYSSTKNRALEAKISSDEHIKILDLITNNYNFLVNKSY